MKLEFQIYKTVEGCKSLGFVTEDTEMIIVGEATLSDEEYFLIHTVNDVGINLIGGMDIQRSAYYMPKKYIKLKTDGVCIDSYEFDIPSKYLTMKIIEDIERLNNI